MPNKVFKILSLSGGGVRGIYQAIILKEISNRLNIKVHEMFDLIAGTSTGALVGAAFAFDKKPDDIIGLFKTKSKDIFSSKFCWLIRRGPRFNQDELKNALIELFGSQTFGEAKTSLLITTTSLDEFKHKAFFSKNEKEKDLSVVDVALSSSAAPIYFNPVRPKDIERAFVDGGLWANSPAIVALHWAMCELKIPKEKIRILSIGTGYFPGGTDQKFFESHRPINGKTITNMLDLIFYSQDSHVESYIERTLGPQKAIMLNSVMNEKISLDMFAKAIQILPALAESAVEKYLPVVKSKFGFKTNYFDITSDATECNTQDFEVCPTDLTAAGGLTAFYPSRSFYASHRPDAATIDKYISTAQSSLVMVSINLMTGLPFDDLCSTLEKKLKISEKFSATISLLDFRNKHLINSIAPALNMTPNKLAKQIFGTIEDLFDFRNKLALTVSQRFNIRVHKTIPFASAIIIDHETKNGRIQLETKAYKEPVKKSFALEIVPIADDCLYISLLNGYKKLINDGQALCNSDLEHGRLRFK